MIFFVYSSDEKYQLYFTGQILAKYDFCWLLESQLIHLSDVFEVN